VCCSVLKRFAVFDSCSSLQVCVTRFLNMYCLNHSHVPLLWVLCHLTEFARLGWDTFRCSPSFLIQRVICVLSVLVISIHMYSFLDGYCSAVQGLLDWFEVDLGFTELLFIQIDLRIVCFDDLHSYVLPDYSFIRIASPIHMCNTPHSYV